MSTTAPTVEVPWLSGTVEGRLLDERMVADVQGPRSVAVVDVDGTTIRTDDYELDP